GIDFGVARRGSGWFRGLTTLACLMNLLPRLDADDRAVALYHGLADVAEDSAEEPPRFALAPLPSSELEPARLARMFRRCIEVRDEEGAERALVSAVRSGATSAELADMLFAAATDHRYLDGGHTLDFVNKALEALDVAGWEHAEAVLGSLPVELASAVSFTAATRIARFPTSNEFGDWDTALHTFTFANAVEQGLRRSPSRELLRGVLDAAISVYLDRFLNVPAARLPRANAED